MPSAGGSTNAALLQAIDALRCDIQELKTALTESIKESVQFRIDFEVRHAEVKNKAEVAHTRLDVQNEEIKNLKSGLETLKETVQKLVEHDKLLRWVGAAVGLAIIGLIISLITGQVVLQFPGG